MNTKKDLKGILIADAKANGRSSVNANLFGDDVWKFIVTLRKLEYYESKKGIGRKLTTPIRMLKRLKYHKYSLKLGFSIPLFVFGKGLGLPHYGTIVVSKYARIDEGCRIHEGVTIGATNGSKGTATIGKNVFIGSGAKIIGEVKIADGVAIGSNAVVTHDIDEPETTWGGIPARKISNIPSYANLAVKF